MNDVQEVMYRRDVVLVKISEIKINSLTKRWNTLKILGLISFMFNFLFIAFAWIKEWKTTAWALVGLTILGSILNAVEIKKIEDQFK